MSRQPGDTTHAARLLDCAAVTMRRQGKEGKDYAVQIGALARELRSLAKQQSQELPVRVAPYHQRKANGR